MLEGTHPNLTRSLTPWPAKSLEERMAGESLMGGQRVAFVANTCDWKWSSETYKWEGTFGAEEVCKDCMATKSGPLNHASFETCTRRLNSDYIARDSIPRLCSIPGWHKDCVLEDAMHIGPLGLMQHVAANALLELAWDDGAWLVPDGGAWADRLNIGLGQAFEEYRRWAKRNKVSTSHKRFTTLQLSMTTWSKSWPMLKCKAANCLTIIRWLAEKCMEPRHMATEHQRLRSAVVWSYD